MNRGGWWSRSSTCHKGCEERRLPPLTTVCPSLTGALDRFPFHHDSVGVLGLQQMLPGLRLHPGSGTPAWCEGRALDLQSLGVVPSGPLSSWLPSVQPDSSRVCSVSADIVAHWLSQFRSCSRAPSSNQTPTRVQPQASGPSSLRQVLLPDSLPPRTPPPSPSSRASCRQVGLPSSRQALQPTPEPPAQGLAPWPFPPPSARHCDPSAGLLLVLSCYTCAVFTNRRKNSPNTCSYLLISPSLFIQTSLKKSLHPGVPSGFPSLITPSPVI